LGFLGGAAAWQKSTRQWQKSTRQKERVFFVIAHTGIESINRYRGTLREEFCDFLGGLWKVRAAVPVLEWALQETGPDAESLSDKPYFAHEQPQMTADFFREAFAPVIRYLASSQSDFAEVAEKLEKEVLLQLADSDLAKAFTEPQMLIARLSKELGLELGSDSWFALQLGVITVLGPTACAAASQITLPEGIEAKDGSCPVCGQPAEIGILKETDELHGSPRELWCAFCETQWPYQRIRCTHCGSRSQTDLSYHFDEGDEKRRIYFCRACSKTQKILVEKDIQNPDEVDLRLEAIALAGLEEAVWRRCLEKAKDDGKSAEGAEDPRWAN